MSECIEQVDGLASRSDGRRQVRLRILWIEPQNLFGPKGVKLNLASTVRSAASCMWTLYMYVCCMDQSMFI